MKLRWSCAATAASVLLLAAGPAGAQQSRRPVVPPLLTAKVIDAEGDRLIAAPAAAPATRGRILHMMPLADNLEFGIGRFAVGEIPRPRTHMEADRYPTDVRRRGRGIAGVGLKISF